MKHLWKILVVAILAVVLLLCFTACGDDATPVDPNNGSTPAPTILLDIKTDRIRFHAGRVVSFPFDGTPHTLEDATGNTEPQNTARRYEYWQNGVKVADEGEGVTAAGVYEVRLYFTKSGYNETYVTATLSIEQSHTISYEVGLPTSLPSGVEMVVSQYNQSVYVTSSDYGNLYPATLEGYKFKGWYRTAACNDADRVTTFEGSSFEGDVTLYAKFQKDLVYPSPYVYATDATAPDTLPAIPGYDGIASDAHKLIDMNLLLAETKAENGNLAAKMMGASYGVPSNESYYTKLNDAVLTAGGQAAFEWCDYNDTFVGKWLTDEGTKSADDGIYNATLNFTIPNVPVSYTNYNTIEFWVYAANTTVTDENPEGDRFSIFLFSDNKDSASSRFNIPIDFSGWKKFTISESDLSRPGGGNMNITKVVLYSFEQFGETASMNTNKEPNSIFFSDIFLTNHSTSYSVTSSIDVSALVDAFENIQDLTLKATLGDAQITAYLTSLATFTQTSQSAPWNDINPATDYDLVYQRVFYMAQSWNDKTSSHYRSDALLDKIGAVLNWLSVEVNKLVDSQVAVDRKFKDSCLYLTDTMNIIGDHINERHAQAWTIPLLYCYPSSIGSGEEALLSAYVYTSANLALNNKRESLVGMRQLTSLFSRRAIALTAAPADILRAMSLIASTNDTVLNPIGDAFINDLFAWFDECVDAFTYEGTIPEDLSTTYNLVPYLRGMFLIYDMATTATQERFVATVKYYLAQDDTLEAALTSARYYDKEETVLAAIKASVTVAATPNTIISIVNESLGLALYKNPAQSGGYYFSVSADGDLVAIDTTVNLTASNYTLFKGMANDSFVAVAASDGTTDTAIIAGPNGVTFNTSGNAYAIDANGNGAYVTNATTTDWDTDAFLYEANISCVVFTTENADGSISCTVYNYSEDTTSINLFFRGSYRLGTTLPAFDDETFTNDGGTDTRIIITPTNIDLKGTNTYTFTLLANS